VSILETDGVVKEFGELAAVADVSIGVEEEEIRSIIGPNGAGKSTLFNLISGLMAPTAGTVRFDDEDITGLHPHEITARGVARSFQITDIFDSLTVHENVRLACQAGDDSRDSMWRHADDLGAVNDAAERIIDDIGLSERAGESAKDLAYGDQRKLEIGLAVANDPELLMLDEPTAGMGQEDTQGTIQLVRRLAQERNFTLLLIEHDLEIVMSISDRITVLTGGSVIAEGPPKQIREDERVQEAYIGGTV
jgi:branched-chain amino acid transport system ATP-binding protein